MSADVSLPNDPRRWTPARWAVATAALALACYLLGTGPLARWAWHSARVIYRPLTPLTNSKVFEPILLKWLSLWGALPWWNRQAQPVPLQVLSSESPTYSRGRVEWNFSKAIAKQPTAAEIFFEKEWRNSQTKNTNQTRGPDASPDTEKVAEAAGSNFSGTAVFMSVPGPFSGDVLKWSAERGNPSAQLKLANSLYIGAPGVPKDYVQAYKWAIVATTNGQHQAIYLIREMELFLSPQQLADGAAAAKAFLNSGTVKKQP